MVWARLRTASEKRMTGGTGLTVDPTVPVSGATAASQLEMVFWQTRKVAAVSSRVQPRRRLISTMRKRWAGE
jgi:hypothetical protein